MSDDVTTAGRRLFIAALLLLAALTVLYEPPDPAPPALQRTADSLDLTRPALDSQLARSDTAGEASARAQRELVQRERSARAAANRARAAADSLAEIAARTASADSAAQAWYLAYLERTKERDSLRAELGAKGARIDLLVADSMRLSDDKRELLARNVALEKFTADLRVAIARASECTILTWPRKVRCPTRKETAVTVLLIDRTLQLAGR